MTIALYSPKYGRFQVLKIQQRTEQLKSHPNLGKMVPELDEPSVREIVEGHYRIIYKIKSNSEIIILFVHHGARNFNKRTNI